MPPLSRTRLALVIATSCCSLGLGCSTFRGLPFTGKSVDELASIDDVRGPTERLLQTVSYEDSAEIAARSDDPALDGAKSIFDAGRYDEAEDAYKTILKRYRPDSFQRTFGNARALGKAKSSDDIAIEEYGSPIEQECLFMIAECQFAQKNFPKAEESYQRLLRRYPSTQHIDTASKRIYAISRHWLGFPPIEVSGGPGFEGDIQQVVFTDVQQSADPTVAPQATGWLNLTDRTKPSFDTTGRALNSLKSIWLNDPTGPLADDALILTGNHYYRNGDPVEAARYYELLREQYPDSPHLKNAYLLESHVKLVSYAGEEYDGTALQQAGALKEQSLQLFPDLSEDQRTQLRTELSQIEDAKIAREWAKVELYRQKNRPTAVRLYCNAIINEYPESRYADQARQLLQTLAEEERNGGRSFWQLGLGTGFERPTNGTIAANPPKLSNAQQPTSIAATRQPEPQPAVISIPDTAPAPPFGSPAQTTAANGVPSGVQQAGFNQESTDRPAVRNASTTDSSENPFAAIMERLSKETQRPEAQKPVEQPIGSARPNSRASDDGWYPVTSATAFQPPGN